MTTPTGENATLGTDRDRPVAVSDDGATSEGYAEEDSDELTGAFRRAVTDGKARLRRSWQSLLATGFIGGTDLSIGVVALLIVRAATDSRLLGAVAFTIGFIALRLGQSELFTENFLVPVTALVAGYGGMWALLRLWVGTLAMNLLAGWGVSWLLLVALPNLAATAREVGVHYPEMGIGAEAFASGVLGGAVITLMTWMQRSSPSEVSKLIAAVVMSFVLAAGPLNHVIVSSVEMFAALQTGQAAFGYADWAGATAWAALANIVGGLGLVTVLRLVQVGGPQIVAQNRRSSA